MVIWVGGGGGGRPGEDKGRGGVREREPAPEPTLTLSSSTAPERQPRLTLSSSSRAILFHSCSSWAESLIGRYRTYLSLSPPPSPLSTLTPERETGHFGGNRNSGPKLAVAQPP